MIRHNRRLLEVSSAIAAHLVLGQPLPQAVQLARQFDRQALAAGTSVKTGRCSSPLNHSFAPLAMQIKAQPAA